MITPTDNKNLRIKPKWQLPIGVMNSIVVYNANKLGLPVPIHLWPFFEGAGNTIHDLMCVQDGTMVNTPTWQGDCIKQTGNTERTDLGTMDITDRSGASVNQCTIVVDCTVDSMTDIDQRIITKESTHNAIDIYWMISTYTGNKIRIRLRAGVSTITLLPGPTWVFELGKQFQTMLRYDGVNVEVYVDGIRTGYTGKTGNVGIDNTMDAMIGGGHTSTSSAYGNQLDGKIYIAQIFPVALTKYQMQIINEDPYCLIRVPPELYGYVASVAAGWTGTINGVTNPEKINGVSVANIVKVSGVS